MKGFQRKFPGQFEQRVGKNGFQRQSGGHGHPTIEIQRGVIQLQDNGFHGKLLLPQNIGMPSYAGD